MRKMHSSLSCIAIAAALALLVPAGASAVVMDSQISGAVLGVLDVHAEAVFNGTLWVYTYDVRTDNANRTVNTFSIGNLGHLAFSNAANSLNFINPVYAPGDPLQDSIIWAQGSLPVDSGARFSFTSPYGPTEVDVSARGGAAGGTGRTLGLVPEPASLLAIGLGASGLVGALLRRRRAG